MNNLLLKCLEVHSTTIIPNFGAIMKLGSSFVFNEFLKFDDGKLITFIASHKSITNEEAKIEIENWSNEILTTVNNGNSYPIASVGVFIVEKGKIVLKKTTELQEVTPTQELIIEEKKETLPVSESKKEPELSEIPKTIEKPKKEIQEIEVEKSSSLSAKMAIASIESFTDKNKLIEYTRGESRKTVIDALNTKLNQLNGKQQINTEVKTEQQKEVAKPEDILEIKKEEDSKDIEALIHLTATLDTIDEFEEKDIIEKEEVKTTTEEPIKPIEKTEISVPINTVEKAIEPAPSNPVELKKEETKPIVEKTTPPKTTQDDNALEIIAEGVLKLEKEEKKRKKKRLILVLALICLLSGGGIMGYLKKDYLMAMINGESTEVAVKKEKKEEAKPASNDDDLQQDSIEVEKEVTEELPEEIIPEKVETPIKEPVKETKPVSTTSNYSNNGNSSGNFLVVAGSFSVEENAKNLVDKLKSEGFSNAYLNTGSGSLIKVVAGTYSSKEEAQSAVEQLTSKGLKGFVQKK